MDNAFSHTDLTISRFYRFPRSHRRLEFFFRANVEAPVIAIRDLLNDAEVGEKHRPRGDCDFGISRKPDFVIEAILLGDESRAWLHHKKCAAADLEGVNQLELDARDLHVRCVNPHPTRQFAHKCVIDGYPLEDSIRLDILDPTVEVPGAVPARGCS